MARVSLKSGLFAFSTASAVSALALLFTTSVSDARLPAIDNSDPQKQAQRPAQTDLLRYAQTSGSANGEGASEGEGRGEGIIGTSFGKNVTATPALTQAIVASLKPGGNVCGGVPKEYRLDCISKTFREAALKMPRNGDYAEARATLTKAADKLDALVKQNQDRSKPRIRVRKSKSPTSKSTKPFTAIKPERVAAVNRQAIPIIAEAETILLRSAASDAKRAVHYQKIAAAVGSNKVLLRSS